MATSYPGAVSRTGPILATESGPARLPRWLVRAAWTAVVVLTVIGVAAVIRRFVVLIWAPSVMGHYHLPPHWTPALPAIAA